MKTSVKVNYVLRLLRDECIVYIIWSLIEKEYIYDFATDFTM